ncbi:hypothetical protein IWQ61_004664 [Dispira simplex]|nr:hypothetical protein IWQ61_004664 [Dispira simplex]
MDAKPLRCLVCLLFRLVMNQPSRQLNQSGAFSFQSPLQRQSVVPNTTGAGLDMFGTSFTHSTINPNLLNVQSFAQGMTIKQEQSSPDMAMQQDVDMGEQLHAMATPISIARTGAIRTTLGDSDSTDELRHNSLNPSSPFAASPATSGLPYSPLGTAAMPENAGNFIPSSYHDGFSHQDRIPINVHQNRLIFQPEHMATSPPLGGGFHSISLPNHTPDWLSSSFDPSSFTSQNAALLGGPNDPAFMSNLFDGDDGEMVKQIAMMNEKRRRRRESHNAVERRRRDNINEKIQELCVLLPENYTEGPGKPNKGVILRRSVEYIRQLQQLVQQQNQRIQDLEAKSSNNRPPSNS